jgi:hypothetical protein
MLFRQATALNPGISQYRDAMSVRAHPLLRVGVAKPPLRFLEEPQAVGSWAGRRLLFLQGNPAFELSYWCGTCPFLFRRLEGANGTLSLPAMEQRLAHGLADFDAEVTDAFAQLLPEGDYLPLLLHLTPRLTTPMRTGDYFADEQVSTWGLSAFWGLPEYPATPYYRTFQTPVDQHAHLFEFVVPMVPPSWNDQLRVAEHMQRLHQSSAPTAVAVATLDVCQPATSDASTDYYEHWALTHFLLDGHHKMQAAADSARPVQLLSLIALEPSLATPEQLTRLLELRAQPAAPRGTSRRG